MKLLHFADLHPDTPFRWAPPEVGRSRRRALRETLSRICRLATEAGAILALLLKIAEQRQLILFTQEEQVVVWAHDHLTELDHAFRTLTPVPAA